MEKNDWKMVGQLMSRLQELYTLVRDTLTEMRIGTEIIPWLMSNGKESLVKKIKELGTEFDVARRVRLTDNPNIIWVNLGAPPKLPFEGAEVVENAGGGWVKVEKRKDELHVDNKKIVLHIDECQKDGRTIKGLKLKEVFTGKPVEHPNILDALLEHPHLIPEEWKGKYVFFWGTIYRDSRGSLCVRCLCWSGSGWDWVSRWLGFDWYAYFPAALRAS